MKILIDSIDRMGKSTLIEGLLNVLGYFLVIHYEKPKNLNFYRGCGETISCLKQYQTESFENMFNLLESKTNIIFDRTHIGENVYAKRYRNYSGDYIFALEKIHASKLNDSILIVLTGDTSILEDDGKSFDYTKRHEELSDFEDSFNVSTIKHKKLVNVTKKIDNIVMYRSKEDILLEVLDFIISTGVKKF
jgi:hypothetical protein